MATAIRPPVSHEDRLSLVQHLDELRSRLIICGAALIAAFALVFWQNETALDLLNKPLEEVAAPKQPAPGGGGGGRLSENARFQTELRGALRQLSATLRVLGRSQSVRSGAERRALELATQRLDRATSALPATTPKREPVTLGVGEPFTTTLTVAAYFALVLALPLILWQLYAFVIPAFTPRERQVAIPLLLLIPLLFVVGVLFAYLFVLPPAVQFLQGFNEGSFDTLVQAKDYYRFEILTMLSLGLVFQVPVGMVALNRLGVVSASRLRRSWRYAIVVIAIVAALLPGVDPVTTMLEMVPLLMLYGLSILLVSWLDRRSARKAGDGEEHEQLPSLNDTEDHDR